MIYGLYPEVVTQPEYAKDTLMNLVNNYLYRDALAFQGMRKPDALIKLVRALALQIGSEVSYNELALTVGIDKVTIENYINLLESSDSTPSVVMFGTRSEKARKSTLWTMVCAMRSYLILPPSNCVMTLVCCGRT